MNKEQKKKLEEIQSQIEEMLCDEQDKYDNSPENLQNTERVEKFQDNADKLQEISGLIDELMEG
jgi:hypothetical protein